MLAIHYLHGFALDQGDLLLYKSRNTYELPRSINSIELKTKIATIIDDDPILMN